MLQAVLQWHKVDSYGLMFYLFDIMNCFKECLNEISESD